MNAPKKPFVLVITGPTASGKTGFSESIAEKIPAAIINADVGQFYTKLSIGTAKPDLEQYRFEHHLFDIIDQPKDLSVAEYRKIVIDRVHEITSKKKLPIIVGGSLFYIKSLFFPPYEIGTSEYEDHNDYETVENLWEKLNAIDSERAKVLHPHDTYRIKRALDIWKKTGVKPSTIQPNFEPPFNTLFIFVCPQRDILHDRISKRTDLMINTMGWIEESRQLIGTPWEDFVKIKGLIGYTDIISWIKTGQKEEDRDALIQKIIIKTRQYAKRQITFWNGFEKALREESKKITDFWYEVIKLDTLSYENSIENIFNYMRDIEKQ